MTQIMDIDTIATPQGIVVYQYVNLNDAEIKGIEASYQKSKNAEHREEGQYQ